ncbi:unnamed protein product [Prunus armeniaca]
MVNEDVDLRSKPGVGVMPGSPQGSSRVPGKFGTGPVILSAIIIAAMLGLIDYEAAILLSKVDTFDFVLHECLYRCRCNIYFRLWQGQGLLFKETFRIPYMVYRNVEQYPNASNVPGILILEIDAPIYFANANYLRERITRWINDEEDGTKSAGESSLQYVILDMTAVGNIDTSGISMFEVVKKLVDRRGLQLVLVKPGSELQRLLQHPTSCFTPPSPTPAKIKNQLHGTTLMALAVNLCIRKQYQHKYEDSFELRRNEFQERTFDGFGGSAINFRKKI